MATFTPNITDLTGEEFERVRKLVYSKCGISLGDEKVQLVRARLGKLVRKGGYSSYGEFLNDVANDQTGRLLCDLLDAISTNTTHLFREIRHFELLKRLIDGWLADPSWRKSTKELRIWSAASSSGEEPHSIAMVAHEAISRAPGVGLKILATDISTKMLTKAKAGIYESDQLAKVPPAYRNRYVKAAREDGNKLYQVVPEVLDAISFSRFNLMTPTFPFRHGFDVVFCRNVMIYFDRVTQETLINKIAEHLRPGGYLMIGHSESLNGVNHPLKYVEPTVYRK